MKKRIGLIALVAALAATALSVTPAAQAQAGLNIPATCTNPTTGQAVDCTLELVGFTTQGGTLNAVFLFTNEVTGQVTRIVVPVTQQQGETCTILELTIGPIDLFLLGLRLETDTIHLVLTAERGTLLGDLLCGLFFGPSPLQQLAGALTGALRTGQIALA